MSMQALVNYVQVHAMRGACQCGKCFDAPEDGTQPVSHTADLTFFQVANNGGTAEELRKLVSEAKDGEFSKLDPFDGKEHSYLELAEWLGDQGVALQLMGLGNLLGLWELLTPKLMGVPDELAKQMAGLGFITILAR